MKKWIQNILYLLTIAGIGVFVYYQRDKLYLFRNLTILNVVVLLLLNFITILLSSYIFKVTISFFKVRLNFVRWYGITVVNTMYNFILPFKGGLALRGFYLKKYFQLNYAKYVSLIAGNFLIILLVSAVIGSAMGLFLYYSGAINQKYLMTITAGLLLTIVLSTIMFFASEFRLKKDGRFAKIFNQVLEGIGFFKQHKSGLFTVLFVQVVFLLVMSYKLYYIFNILGMDGTYAELVFIQSLVIFSRVFAFTPGNIGLREGVVGLSASILGMDLETALLAALLDRMISVVFIFANGAFFSKILIQDITRFQDDDLEDSPVTD